METIAGAQRVRPIAAALAVFFLTAAVVFGLPSAVIAFLFVRCGGMCTAWMFMLNFPIFMLLAVVGLFAGLWASHCAYRRMAHPG